MKVGYKIVAGTQWRGRDDFLIAADKGIQRGRDHLIEPQTPFRRVGGRPVVGQIVCYPEQQAVHTRLTHLTVVTMERHVAGSPMLRQINLQGGIDALKRMALYP